MTRAGMLYTVLAFIENRLPWPAFFADHPIAAACRAHKIREFRWSDFARRGGKPGRAGFLHPNLSFYRQDGVERQARNFITHGQSEFVTPVRSA